jgi:hypothetical protein
MNLKNVFLIISILYVYWFLIQNILYFLIIKNIFFIFYKKHNKNLDTLQCH